ncbi:MAG: hypothetical protein HKN58_02400 [Xanthomonadales bacterium]|nr:hypothetical protein [Xanthomonadales bacterium]
MKLKVLAVSVLVLGFACEVSAQSWRVISERTASGADDSRTAPTRPPRFEEIFRRSIFGRRWLPEPDGTLRPPVVPEITVTTRHDRAVGTTPRGPRPPKRPK